MPFTDGWYSTAGWEAEIRGSAITEIEDGHFLLELDEKDGPVALQLRNLVFDPMARRGVRLYLVLNGVAEFPRSVLEQLQALELKFRVHGGGIAIISTDDTLMRKLRVTGLCDLIGVYHDVDLAVDCGRRMQGFRNSFLDVG